MGVGGKELVTERQSGQWNF